MYRFKRLTWLIIIGLFIGLSFNIWHIYRYRQLKQRRANWVVLEEKIKKQAKTFGQETGIVIEDLSTGWKITVNANRLFPSASMVKVPIMAGIFYARAEKTLDLKQRLVLKNRHKALGSGVLKEYAQGTTLDIDDLIELMIIESDNTAANMLIEYLGLAPLNNYFKKMGLNNTNIARKMMDFKSRRYGLENFTSASDLAYLLEEIYNYKLINKGFSRRCLGILKKQKIRDRIPAKLPPGTIVAHKTGLERGVCHDTGIVFTPRGDFIICVLTQHHYKTSRPAKKFISDIALDVYNYCQS